jgi:hypothetical protein
MDALLMTPYRTACPPEALTDGPGLWDWFGFQPPRPIFVCAIHETIGFVVTFTVSMTLLCHHLCPW